MLVYPSCPFGKILTLVHLMTTQANTRTANYADYCWANNGYTISILSHIPITECSNVKKIKVRLRIYETILPCGSLTVFRGVLWYLQTVLLAYLGLESLSQSA